jgi:hypothetical protein
VLDHLERRGIPAPRLVGHQPEGCLLMTLEPGRPVHRPADLRRHVGGLVEVALRLHDSGLPPIEGLRQQVPRLRADVQEAAPWRHGNVVDAVHWATVIAAWPSVTLRPDTFIHDDFHPGNTLWRRGRLTSVVDWTGASVGQAASDITYLALDVSLVLGLEAGDLVYEAYTAATGSDLPDRPFWELFSAARAVGVVDLWHGSWIDFGITDLPLPLVEERLDAYVGRALAAV